MPTDKFSNQGYMRLTPTLNALSFTEFATFVSVFEKKAFLVSRIEYLFPAAAVLEFTAEGDRAIFGLSTADTWTGADLSQAQIFDFNALDLVLVGAGVSSHIFQQPIIKDWSTLPGGGILVPSRPIFLWMVTGGWAAANYLDVKVFFTVVDLKADEYWELVESTRLVGA